MQNAREILERIKKAFTLKNDASLARMLKIKPSTLYTWKNRESLDYPLILTFCKENNIDLHWLLSGEGEMFKKNDIIDKESLDNVSQKILIMLEGMTEEEKREVLRNVEDKKLFKELKEEFLKKKTG